MGERLRGQRRIVRSRLGTSRGAGWRGLPRISRCRHRAFAAPARPSCFLILAGSRARPCTQKHRLQEWPRAACPGSLTPKREAMATTTEKKADAPAPTAKKEWAPRIWEGCSFPGWIRLLARNRFAVHPACIYIAVIVT